MSYIWFWMAKPIAYGLLAVGVFAAIFAGCYITAWVMTIRDRFKR